MATKILPIKTGDRQVDAFNVQTRLAVDEIQTALGLVPDTARIMPIDQYTYLCWPCIDALESGTTTTVANRTSAGAAQLVVSGAAINETGMTPTGRGFARIYGSTGGYLGAGGLVPNSTSVSISAWIRVGDASGVSNLFGYFAAGTGLFAFYLNAANTPAAVAQTVAGLKTVTCTPDMRIANGEWHLYTAIFTGTDLIVGVDTAWSSAPFAATTIDWALVGAKNWRLGFPSASTGYMLARDVRVHSRALPANWINEAYARWHGVTDLL